MLPSESDNNNHPRRWIATELHPEDVVPLLPALQRYRVPRTPSQCWLWAGATNRQGYGVVGGVDSRGRRQLAHRVAWVLASGATLAADISIDHLCRNTRCANPQHLEPVPIEENIRRGYTGRGCKARPKPSAAAIRPVLRAFDVDERGRLVCPVCNIAFGRSYLKTHMRQIHSEAV